MEILFIGSGDAFGSGGRLQPCVLVTDNDECIAIDFGLTALIGLKQHNIDPNTISTVILSHLHGDHCGGTAFLLMDSMLGLKREQLLTIIGPEGVENHIKNLQEALFPGSSIMKPKFDVDYTEFNTDEPLFFKDYTINVIEAKHTAATLPKALKLEKNGKSMVYTGDGECTDELKEFTAGADLLIAESYYYDKPVKWHLNYPDISALKAKKTVLTHMSDNMLSHADDVPELCAFDGLKIKL